MPLSYTKQTKRRSVKRCNVTFCLNKTKWRVFWSNQCVSLSPVAPPPPKRAPTTALSMRSKSMTSELEELGKSLLVWLLLTVSLGSVCLKAPLSSFVPLSYCHWLVNLSIVDKGKQLMLHNHLPSILLNCNIHLLTVADWSFCSG